MVRRWALAVIPAVAIALLIGCATPGQPTSTAPAAPGAAGTEQSGAAPATAAPSGVAVALLHIKRYEEGMVLARVNGEEIRWEDYEPNLRQTLVALSQQRDLPWGDPAMQQRLGHLQNDVLKQTVDRFLLRQMAARQGIAVGETDLKAEAERERASILKSGQYASWEAFLEGNGLTERSFSQVIHDTMLLDAYLAAQSVKTEEEQIHLAHIVVAERTTADEILAKLGAGEAFEALAAQYSQDAQTKDAGGDLGWFALTTAQPNLLQAALSLEPGQVSEPIVMQGSYVIVKLLGREVRPLEPQVLKQRQRQAMMAQLEAERAKAQIEYLVDFAKPDG